MKYHDSIGESAVQEVSCTNKIVSTRANSYPLLGSANPVDAFPGRSGTQSLAKVSNQETMWNDIWFVREVAVRPNSDMGISLRIIFKLALAYWLGYATPRQR